MNEDLIRLGLVDEGAILLDDAALVLAQLDHPDTDIAPYRVLTTAISGRLRDIGGNAQSAARQATALADVIAGGFGFAGDSETYDDPANADMIRVIDRRRGLPISLSILYVAAARKIGWIANVLDVPGHVLVLIGKDAAPVIIDPFRSGVRVSRDRLAALVASGITGPMEAATHVGAMPNRAILVRLLLNQASRAERGGQGRRALVLYRRMTSMAPDYGHAWWERARLELIDHDVAAARDSLSSMLEVTREPVLRRKVSSILSSLADQ